MTAYYNENDPRAAAWLRQLIADGLIPEGEVDERDIRDVVPGDLVVFRQCHFFAGIGGWPYALRLAGWPDDRPVWTGSCPCQPFSQAGSKAGFADERHLWPAWFHMVEQCRPPVIYGEQVASALEWLDLVFDDLEGTGYACRAEDLCAAGVGAPHIRQRLFWMADAGRFRIERYGRDLAGAPKAMSGEAPEQRLRDDAGDGSGTGRLADADRGQRNGVSGRERCERHREEAGRREKCPDGVGIDAGNRAQGQSSGSVSGSAHQRTGPLDGFWRDADWLGCRDECWRPVEPGTFPLAHGVSGRVGLLRGYGNAIVPQLAAEFVRGFL